MSRLRFDDPCANDTTVDGLMICVRDHADTPGLAASARCHASVHDPKMDGDTTFVSWYSLGVVAANSANPSQPTLRGQFVPDTQYVNPDYYCTQPCADVWGVALHGDLVLASDMNSGLYVLRLH